MSVSDDKSLFVIYIIVSVLREYPGSFATELLEPSSPDLLSIFVSSDGGTLLISSLT